MVWAVVAVVFAVFAAIGWFLARRSVRFGASPEKLDQAHARDVSKAQRYRGDGGDHNGFSTF